MKTVQVKLYKAVIFMVLAIGLPAPENQHAEAEKREGGI